MYLRPGASTRNYPSKFYVLDSYIYARNDMLCCGSCLFCLYGPCCAVLYVNKQVYVAQSADIGIVSLTIFPVEFGMLSLR
jgi:hypothetical protein